MKKYLLLFLFPLVSPAALAQYRPWKYWQDTPGAWSVAIQAGATRYAGDMSEEKDVLRRPRLGAEASASALYRFADRLSARADGRLYFLQGRQEGTRVWYNNLSFVCLNPEISAGIQADLFPPDPRERPFNPYLYAGLGLTYLNTMTGYLGKLVSLPPLRTEGVSYSRIPPVLKLQIGYPVRVWLRYRLALEFGYTVVFSDYLDDVSTVYPDFSALAPMGQALSDRRVSIGLPPNEPGNQRGNSIKRDGYFSLSLRLTRLMKTEADSRYKRVIGW
ncbi:hypothetical protein F5984_08605 [Rudanella paleaurantiibacter]|uniref:Outer membrane beta-barrel protein n=1 Tax=Rudanella paleaurantiibacter TaxID=2614655 RepID=A0A7J5U3H0_9BACT|nr:hypothetical protein [Rudanella paleaurantiibacter]KAB7732250.1 hypothetical protein F5984_08605 [Rudanella paleaurantiibacter]